MESQISVLLANDVPLLRSSMSELLNSSPNLRLVASAKATHEVLTLADLHRPRIGVMDLDLEWPVLNDLVSRLANLQTTTLVMTDELDDEQTFGLLKAGANGIISRRAEPDLLCRSISALARGEMWISRECTSQLIQRLLMQPGRVIAAPAPQEEPVSKGEPASQTLSRFGLTPRELQVVRAIGEAMSNKDIAVQLGISEYTVKHHLTRIFDKIGVYSRLELAMMATHYGLVGGNQALAVA